MAAAANLFENFWDQALATPVNYPSDDIRMLLLTSSAAPSLGSWIHYSDVTNEVANGNGYTTGGVALGSKSHTVTLANSWTPTWAATTAYTYGEVVKPSGGNGYLYMCAIAGTSNSSAPTFPTVPGETVTDSGVTWVNIGESITVWSSGNATWTATTGNTIAAEYGIIYDNTPATSATKPLIALVNFGSVLSATGAALTISPDATYGWFVNTPF